MGAFKQRRYSLKAPVNLFLFLCHCQAGLTRPLGRSSTRRYYPHMVLCHRVIIQDCRRLPPLHRLDSLRLLCGRAQETIKGLQPSETIINREIADYQWACRTKKLGESRGFGERPALRLAGWKNLGPDPRGCPPTRFPSATIVHSLKMISHQIRLWQHCSSLTEMKLPGQDRSSIPENTQHRSATLREMRAAPVALDRRAVVKEVQVPCSERIPDRFSLV